ncbi:HEAT repeat domain-containing protein [Jannaschia pohangensis]|uniref:Repeat domain-containing protein n=1 Tax=Jannaschia pohangensis TaxID=390807 RepID=A0A1I3QZH9_9RHOB|nr:FG-GAP-like repeat-containing protein [Jannaschia pohangensis]SFJ38681.1 Repeat domain-containing protein [Jannaschia pohangensis]
MTYSVLRAAAFAAVSVPLLPGLAAAQFTTIPGVGWEGAGAGATFAQIDSNPRPDLIFMAYDDPARDNNFRYRIGFNVNAAGQATSWSSDFIRVDGLGWEGDGAGVAVGNIDGDSRPDMILMAYDDPTGANSFRYRVGKDLNSAGVAASWSGSIQVPGVGHKGAGAAVALAQLDGDSRPDMILMAYDDPVRGNSFRYRVGLNLNSNGIATAWSSSYLTAPGVGWEGQGAGMDVTDLDGNGVPDVIFMAYDNPERSNNFRYRVGMNMAPNGAVESWSEPFAMLPGVGWEGQGAGAAVADLDGDGAPEMIVMAYDNPERGNTFRYRLVPSPIRPTAEIALTVSRHEDTTLTNADVDRIFADASAVLQADDGGGDVACPVRLRRNGDVGVFTTGDGSLDTSAELQAVFALAGNIKVVDDVNFCAGGFNSSFIGCGQTPGSSFITERFTASLEGILWGHEFGHNTGLPHNSSSNFVMFGSIGSSRIRVTNAECNSLLARAGSPATGALTGALALPQADDVIRLERVGDFTPGAVPIQPIKDFVTQIYFEGLPLDVAASYGPDVVPELVEMLADPSLVTYHENIALTLGLIGSPLAAEPLQAYVSRGGVDDGDLRRAEKGIVGAVIGLGYLAGQTSDPELVQFLIDLAEPTELRSETAARLATKAGGSVAEANDDVARYAIISLGFTGQPEASAFLERTLAAPEDVLKLRVPDVQNLLRQGIESNDLIRRDGLQIILPIDR